MSSLIYFFFCSLKMKQLYAKLIKYEYLHKHKHTKEYTKIVICSKYTIYLLPKYIDDILVDIRFECIGSLIYQVILDLLLDRCIGLTKNEVKNTIRNVSTYELVSKISKDINEIDRYVDIEILKHRLLNNI